MALQECALNINRELKELRPHGTLEFPCAGYSSFRTEREEDVIPWHWHDEIEFLYIEDGSLNLKVPSATLSLKKGDCAAVNSNILHCAAAAEFCKLNSLVFGPSLITGNDEFAFGKKYIQPLISCCSFSGCVMQAGESEQVVSWFQKAFEALKEDCFGFEFTVRENLSRICLFLYKKYEQEICIREVNQSQDYLRIRAMLQFIHSNYSEPITVSEVARAADIGERECLRCFQKTIQLSPIQYLLKYRVMQGAELLLNHPVSSISEIAMCCGFDSPSNFAKMFKRFYKRTPREYRKIKEKENFNGI